MFRIGSKIHEVDHILSGSQRNTDFACPRITVIEPAATIAIHDPSLQPEAVAIDLFLIVVRTGNQIAVRVCSGLQCSQQSLRSILRNEGAPDVG
jgi:hypothetical protein